MLAALTACPSPATNLRSVPGRGEFRTHHLPPFVFLDPLKRLLRTVKLLPGTPFFSIPINLRQILISGQTFLPIDMPYKLAIIINLK